MEWRHKDTSPTRIVTDDNSCSLFACRQKERPKIPTSEDELFLAQSTKSGAKAKLPSTPGSLWGMDFRGDVITVNVLNTTKPSSFEKEFNFGKGGVYISPGKKS